jgi:hypothetical protein
MRVANFIPTLAALAWLGEYWWLKQDPQNFLVIGSAMILFCLLAAIVISARAKEKHWWNAALLPLVANTVVLGYTVIVSSQLLIDFLVVVLLVLNYVYWRFVYFYYNRPSRYTSFSLENLSFYVNFISVFFLGALAYGLRAFLQYSLWSFLAGVAVVLALILYQGVWAAKVDWHQYGWYGLIHLLILLEFFGVLSLLPLDYNLLGLLWASIYYLLLILFNDLMSHRFNHKRLRRYLFLVAAVWLVLLLTASWL